MSRQLFALVYQSGLANVFARGESKDNRVFQGDYRGAEMLCQGALLCGASVEIYHFDKAGDANVSAQWEPGIGDLWTEHKNPPKSR